MSSYLSNILTNTTSKYNTLRQNLTSSEADGDTEDDSHISRVLRAYYTEKGRSFPQWLPPDPKRSISSQSVAQSFTSSLRQPSSNATATMGNMQNGQQQQQQQQGRPGHQPRKASLSDLWDQPSQRVASPQPMSLRRQAGAQGGRGGGDVGLQVPTTARPLPSQRAGSYQSVKSQQGGYNEGSSPAPGSSGGGGTAQERLKARLWGRGGSSTNLSTQGLQQQQQQNPYAPRDRFGPR